MSFFDFLSGSNPIGALVDNTVGKVVDKALAFIPDPVQQAAFLTSMRQLDLSELQQQVDVNKIEAASTNLFNSGWRPFIGWVCGSAFAYKFILGPMLIAVTLMFDPEFNTAKLPVLDWTELGAVLFGMLGLSRDRSKEKQAIIKAKSGN